MRTMMTRFCLVILFFYGVLPYLLSRGFGWKVIKKSTHLSEVALTFDDGPNPLYTPMLLDILKKYNVKATFFVLGYKAQLYPDIIKKIHDEGHQIGIHNEAHLPNWSMRPKTVQKGVERTSQLIYSLIGERATVYRPPWGMLNAYDLLKKTPYTIVLWSLMAEDWRIAGGIPKIVSHLLKSKGGDIILLHDCGKTFGAQEMAPMNTIQALDIVLPELQDRGLQFVKLDKWIAKDPRICRTDTMG
ncbi:polysaccharide deacetylase family protein [Exiguobacterium artemiae]|uniref:polysaccharide deacetylase family protein n=1 Tax=Exiguobacterium artemiae TaxID=340145 RepID=UPI00068470D2|nr:polysaccharide deacetylase family protein [Exiguobacterium sibiricum]